MVETELENRRKQGLYNKEFKGQSHFFGYFREMILRRLIFIFHGLRKLIFFSFSYVHLNLLITLVLAGHVSFSSYEGRCGLPSNFDSNYCYALGYGAGALLHSGKTGLISSVCTPFLDSFISANAYI